MSNQEILMQNMQGMDLGDIHGVASLARMKKRSNEYPNEGKQAAIASFDRM